MLAKRMKRTLGIALFALVPLTLPVVTAGMAQSHGFTQSPSSRQDACAQGKVSDCGTIVWEPQSVEGPKGFPQAGPADGKICSAGLAQFAELDDPRGGQWPATNVSAGQDFTFTWKITAAHSTMSFRYFVTKDGWDPSQPLTRAALEPAPFVSQDLGGQRPPNTYTHTGKLPNKSGKHVILGVWDIADTGNAFYSCADVNFG
ncbi:chitin-binding protein [Saccharopolyspora erythraea NRRL 2338]|uniref:Secreted chitin binding protein n=2 Tax=Saccharopolyspora erythraea TaxID=1836 RepID=A4F5Y9_SACEN|nr:lytic polysaccharide monooxygenase auxiliary activity family 9 protein [Saccharopolyspora erythraea]PFG93262.1 chitin-binding protein [Saccharopolyspora erythraea NRRL 2338]CAL99463.1 secreted chitin binding protein [Saccharopolyspora erythraea NRRL 2338]